jgi:hypothetical protein
MERVIGYSVEHYGGKFLIINWVFYVSSYIKLQPTANNG